MYCCMSLPYVRAACYDGSLGRQWRAKPTHKEYNQGLIMAAIFCTPKILFGVCNQPSIHHRDKEIIAIAHVQRSGNPPSLERRVMDHDRR